MNQKQLVEKKVVFLGNSGVGKSTLIRHLIHGQKYRDSCFSTTIGAERYHKDIEIEKNNKKETQRMQIWDTTGQEKFRSLTPIYYRDADAFIIVFSLADTKSFEAIKDYWIQSVQDYGPMEVIIAIVGTY